MKKYVLIDNRYWQYIAKPQVPVSQRESFYSAVPTDFLDYLRPPPPAEKEADVLESILEERSRFLAGSISQFSFFHKERLRISRNLQDKLDYDIAQNQSLIFELDFWPLGTESIVESRRSQLENIQTSLEQEKRREEVSCWNDLLKVAQDVQSVLREYVELQIRTKLLQTE